MKWMVEYHIALWCLQLPRSPYLSIYVCPKKGRVNGSGPAWGWRTPGIYTQLLTSSREGVSGCSGPQTSSTPSPERSRGRFWDQLENALMEDSRRHQTPIREVAPHFKTDVQLQRVCKPDSKQTDGCPPSFFYSWNLDIGAGRFLLWGRVF